MSRARYARVFSVMLGLAIAAGSLLPGCGGPTTTTPPFKEEDAPAVKGKDSMDYFRNNMLKKQGAKK